jgi:hypothetical protein
MPLHMLESAVASFSGGKFENNKLIEKPVRLDFWARAGTRNIYVFVWPNTLLFE